MTHARSEYKDFMSLTPDAYAAVLALGQVAGKAGMDKQLLELIKLRASQINGCAFCVQYHILEGEKLGVPTDKLNLVVVWREAPQFSPRERAALAWTEALTLLSEGVSDEVYAQASANSPKRNSPISRRRWPRSMSGTGSARLFAGLRRRGSRLSERRRRRLEFGEVEAGAVLGAAWRIQVGSGHLFLLNSTQILDDLQNSFFRNLLRVARHIQQQFNRFRLGSLSFAGPTVVPVDIPKLAFRACDARLRLGHPLSLLLQRQKIHRCYSWREPSNRRACVSVCWSSGSRPCHPHRGTPRILTETRSGRCRDPEPGPGHWLRTESQRSGGL